MVSSDARFSTQRFRKLSSTSAAIAELSFARFAFFENRQPLEQQSAAMQKEHKKALIMLKTGLNVTREDFDSEGNFFRFALARISVFVRTMSEQPATPPPALRLKPRLRSADGEAPAETPTIGDPTSFPPPPPVISTGAAISPEVAEVPTASKIRFKPKMAEASGTTVASPAPQISESTPAVVQPPTMANPHVTAPGPAPFATPPAPPPFFGSNSSPAAPTIATPPAPAAEAGAAAPVDANKFKLKPKAPSPVPPPVTSASVPPVVAAPSLVVVPPFAAPPSVKGVPPSVPGAKSPPPFPVVAPPVALKGAPPPFSPVVPITAKANVGDDSESSGSAATVPRKSSKAALIGLAAVIVLGAGYFGWKYFMPQKAAPAPTPTVKSTPPPAPVPKSDPAPTPSETLNKLAHAPKNAIDQAQEVIAARRASGQTRIDAASIGEDLPDKPATPATAASQPVKAPAKSATASTTTTTNAPNVSATTMMEAAPEATVPFRSFVANAKVSGVFQGSPSRAVINGKLTRAGDIVEPGLGITFTGIDSERRQLVFKDKTGATVSRRF